MTHAATSGTKRVVVRSRVRSVSISAARMSLPASFVSLLLSLLLALGSPLRSQCFPSPHLIDQNVVVRSLDQIVDIIQHVIAVRDIGGHDHEDRQEPHPILTGRAKALSIPLGRHQLNGRVRSSLKGGRQPGHLLHARTLVECASQLRHRTC